MKLGIIFLLLTLNQMIYSVPVTHKSVENRELDSWLADIEQALDEEMPGGGAIVQEKNIKEGPALDRNGKPANREGPVDMEDWEAEIETKYGGQNFNEEIESKVKANAIPSDDDLGYEPDTANGRLGADFEDNLPQANSMEYSENNRPQVVDNIETDKEQEQSQYKTEPVISSYNSNNQLQEFWEEEYKQVDEQQADTAVTTDIMKIQELENYIDEPSHVPEDHSWEDNWEENSWQDKPELPENQQGYYMEIPNDNKQQEKDKPWKEPGPKDFDDLQFDDKFKNDDMEEDPTPDVNKQPFDDNWKQQGPKDFDDLQFNDRLKSNGMKEDFVNSQSDDVEVPVDVEEQRSWESEYNNFDDLGVAEDMSIDLDNALVDEAEPWAVSNDVPDDVQPKIMSQNKGQFNTAET